MVDAVDAGALVTGFATRESGVGAVGARSTRSLGVGTGVGAVRVAFAVLADLERFEEVAFCVVVDARLLGMDVGVVATGSESGFSCGVVGVIGVVGVAATGGSSDSSGSADCLDSVASDPASVVVGSLPAAGSGSGSGSISGGAALSATEVASSGGVALSATEVVSSAGGSGAAGAGVGSGLSMVGAVEAVDASGCTSEVAGATALGAVRVLTISGVRTSCG